MCAPCMCLRACTYTHVYTYAHACASTCTHVHACVQCTHVCMCSCLTRVCARSPVLCDRSRRVCDPACQQGAAWAWVPPNIPGAPGEEKQRWIRPAFPESGSKSLPGAHQGAGLCRLPDVQPWAPLGSRSLSFSVCRVGSSWLLARRKDSCRRDRTVAAGRAAGSLPPPLLLVAELPSGWNGSPPGGARRSSFRQGGRRRGRALQAPL